MFHQKEYIMMNKKWLPHIITIAAFLLFGFLGLACESSPETYNSAVNSYTGSSSSGLDYYFYNGSSEYVTLSDATGSHTMPPGESFKAHFNSSASVSSVSYSPVGSVGVTQSGTSFTFYDK
jgi:hypothetical protein